MRVDVFLDAPQAPFRQGVDLGSREFEPRNMHRKRLTDALRKFFVGGIAALGQRLCQLLGEWIAQQNEVVQAFDSGAPRRQLPGRKVIERYVEVQEIARRMELRAELFRWCAYIQRAGRHQAVEYDLAPPGQFQPRGLQGNGYEIAIGRCYRFRMPRR